MYIMIYYAYNISDVKGQRRASDRRSIIVMVEQ